MAARLAAVACHILDNDDVDDDPAFFVSVDYRDVLLFV